MFSSWSKGSVLWFDFLNKIVLTVFLMLIYLLLRFQAKAKYNMCGVVLETKIR